MFCYYHLEKLKTKTTCRELIILLNFSVNEVTIFSKNVLDKTDIVI